MYKLGDQYLMRFRVYDTQTARWIFRDPIPEVGGIHLYGYVGGNPINYWDLAELFNPLKGMVSIGNTTIAGLSYVSAATKYAIAAGLLSTGVGSPSSGLLFAWGRWNLNSANGAWKRSLQGWNEALCEGANQASWRIFYTFLPKGNKYDDNQSKYSGSIDYFNDTGWGNFLLEILYF